VLDKGFVRLVDVMGDDTAIVRAARVCTDPNAGGGRTPERTPEQDRKLIWYLWTHGHTSPFEMAELKFHVKAPIFVARQWVRHRTASWNELSARYAEVPDEFYVPMAESIAAQSKSNKQGRGEPLRGDTAATAQYFFSAASADAHRTYRDLLAMGVARELARAVLPVSTYTQWVWKIDLRNFLHFLTLRLDEHAQYEIREYAQALLSLAEPLFPTTFRAWREGAQ
jgi:thymidylate synthase (FAD)